MGKYIVAALVAISFILSISLIRTQKASSAAIRKPQRISRTASLTLLMKLPKEGNLKADPVFSRDGSKVAALFSLGKKNVVVVNGKEMPAHDEVRNLCFDRNNAFCFTGRKDSQWHLVSGDSRGKGYQEIIWLERFADGNDIWWLANEGENRCYTLMRNRTEVGNSIDNPETLYSWDRQHMAVYGFRNEKRVFFVDGIELNPGDIVQGGNTGDMIPYFDPKGTLRFFKRITADSGEYIEFNSKRHNVYESIASWAVSPDGSQIAYLAEKKQGNGFIMVRNGSEGKLYREVRAPRFSPDGSKLAYIVGNGPVGRSRPDGDDEKPENYAVVVNEKKGKAYAQVSKPIFSPDSAKLAYIAENNKGQSLVVINETEGKAYDEIADFIFSPDSRNYAFRAKADARWFIVVNDQEGDSYHWVGVPSFSADGNRLAYGARGGISLLKDRNGNILAYPVRKKGGEPYLDLQVDAHGLTYAGHKSGERLWVTTDGWLYTSRDEDELYWVNETIAQLSDGSSVTSNPLYEKPRVKYVFMAKGAKSLPFGFSFADRNALTGENDTFSMMTLFTAVPGKIAQSRNNDQQGDGEEYALMFQKFDLREIPFRSDAESE